ncbi:C40 family peptidase [Flavobacterium sp.]|uniref:C40 family peptidase n=1 Tax=Flavobacterium sp. TaxID=239 RepID=UPI003752C070
MKYLFYLFLLLILVTSCKSTSSAISSTKKETSRNTSNLRKQLVNDASDKVGMPYRLGGITKAGYDCSGLVFSTFKDHDISLPRTSIDMSKKGEIIQSDNAKKGDLIFFKTNGKSQINHVGLIVEVLDDEIIFVHSSTQLGVIISSTKEAYYKKSFVQINRIIN